MGKSPDAFRTISEVAEWLETQAHVLRFWESKFTQVKPVKRAGGRRYYRPADMLLLGGIKKLLHEDGMTIKGAQKLLREHGIKHVSAMSQPLDDVLSAQLAEEDLRPAAVPLEDPDANIVEFAPVVESAQPVDQPIETTEPSAVVETTEVVPEEPVSPVEAPAAEPSVAPEPIVKTEPDLVAETPEPTFKDPTPAPLENQPAAEGMPMFRHAAAPELPSLAEDDTPSVNISVEGPEQIVISPMEEVEDTTTPAPGLLTSLASLRHIAPENIPAVRAALDRLSQWQKNATN